MERKTTSIFLVTLLCILIAVAAGSSSYLALADTYQNESQGLQAQIDNLQGQKEKLEIKNGTFQTKNWTKFENIPYSFKIKYPHYMQLDSVNNNFYIKEIETSETTPSTPASQSNSTALQLTITNIASNLTLNQAAQNFATNNSGIQYKIQNMKIDNQPAIKLISECSGMGCGNPNWVVISKNLLFTITPNQGYSKTFDRIVSTLQFTN